MEFSYLSYKNFMSLLREHGYQFADYHNWTEKTRPVILRHDIDFDLKASLALAALEADAGVASTYFVIVTSDLYNVFSNTGREALNAIASMGHEIGLHYDEMAYPDAIGNHAKIAANIRKEAGMLESVLERPVTTVSMHRPGKHILDADLQIPGIINSYGKTFFHHFKYLSDSRRRWREPVEEIIRAETFQRLHILTHAFWYREKETNLHDTLSAFINAGSKDRYQIFSQNFTNLADAMPVEEVKA